MLTILNAISFKCGTRKKMEVFNSKAIPQGFSSTTGISKKLPAVRDKLSQLLLVPEQFHHDTKLIIRLQVSKSGFAKIAQMVSCTPGHFCG